MQRIKNPLRGQETKIHQQLKKLYLDSVIQGEQEVLTEIDNRKFRIDVFDTLNNRAFEIQRHNFGKGFYDKIELLTQKLKMKVIIVHPIVIKQKITRMKNGNIIGTSYINKTKKADFYSLFEKLVSFRTSFIPGKLGFDVLLIREHVKKEFIGRWKKSNRPRYKMIQRELISIENSINIRKKADLLTFLPENLPKVFTNRNISDQLEIQGNKRRKSRIAGWMTYSLCNLGLLSQVGKKGRAHLFKIPK